MGSGRLMLTLIFGTLFATACGGGSSSGGGGALAGTCTFSVGSDGTATASAIVQTPDAALAAQIQSDCRAVARGIEIARNYCGYPLQTRHIPTIERRGELYGYVRENVKEEPRISRQDLPSRVVSLAAGHYMLENGVDTLSCHGLSDRLNPLIN